MKFLERVKHFWECFTAWDVPPTHLHDAHVILAHAAGDTPEGPRGINKILAARVRGLHKRYRLPVVAQAEVAQYLHDIQPLRSTEKQRAASHRLDTRDICLFFMGQSVTGIANRRAWSKVIVIAARPHLWRVVKTLERLGFHVRVPQDLPKFRSDPKSPQWWCRRNVFFYARELAARLWYLWRGWI